MGRLLKLVAAGGLLLLGRTEGLAEEGGAPPYVVIVNSGNSVDSMSSREVSRLFLRKTTKWEGSGTEVLPVDQVYDYEVTERFCRGVHNKSTSWLRSYWRKQVFSGRGYPPKQLKSDDAVIEHVSSSSGGIGYVTGGATLPDGVKALEVSGD